MDYRIDLWPKFVLYKYHFKFKDIGLSTILGLSTLEVKPWPGKPCWRRTLGRKLWWRKTLVKKNLGEEQSWWRKTLVTQIWWKGLRLKGISWMDPGEIVFLWKGSWRRKALVKEILGEGKPWWFWQLWWFVLTKVYPFRVHRFKYIFKFKCIGLSSVTNIAYNTNEWFKC